jgi:hypothetical protein
MSRITLAHWNAAEAKQRAGLLRKAGHRVRVLVPESGADFTAAAAKPPEAFVIDLDRRPSDGREVGLFFRQRKATRGVPIVFAGGEPAKVAGVRKVLPDAVFTSWRGVRGAVRKALASPPKTPLSPGQMAAYKGTPLPKKLGIKEGRSVALLGAPAGFERKLAPLPDDVSLRRQARGRFDLIVLFTKSRADLQRRFPVAARALAEGGRLWIAWPKQASGVRTDLTQIEVRSHGMGSGFVDYKICAIDETWSGLCFARREPG